VWRSVPEVSLGDGQRTARTPKNSSSERPSIA
jgi:hypothetical protein